MAEKVTFDGPNKIINVNYGETELDAQRDIYSAWKRWLTTPPSAAGVPYNAGYLEALRTVGGDPIGGGQFVSAYFFLMNGWRLRSWAGNHFLTVNGNLYVDEGGSPVVPTVGSYQIVVSFVVSPQSITTTSPTVTAGVITTEDKQDITQGVWSEPASVGGVDSMGELQRDINTNVLSVSASIDQNSDDLKRILGLVHENIFIDNPTYDSDGNMTAARLRIYSNPASVGTASDVIGTYQITAPSTAPGQFASWKQVRTS